MEGGKRPMRRAFLFRAHHGMPFSRDPQKERDKGSTPPTTFREAQSKVEEKGEYREGRQG